MAASLRRAASRRAIGSLQIPNRLEYIDLFLAATRLGVVLVPINVLYREREAGHILRDASPKALVSDSIESM
jgi:acyl-CoA synthetase (AMP-forming)/AMP-acid ligase II